MRKYKLVSILWEDHIRVNRSRMVENPEDHFIPTLSVGIIYKETKKAITLIQEVEKYENHDDITYLVIRKPILALKEFGDIELETLRE